MSEDTGVKDAEAATYEHPGDLLHEIDRVLAEIVIELSGPLPDYTPKIDDSLRSRFQRSKGVPSRVIASSVHSFSGSLASAATTSKVIA